MAAKSGDVILDGDALREVWPGLGFSKADRWEQNLRVARLARCLSHQGLMVYVAVIAPYRDLRKEIAEICGCEFIYLSGGNKSGPAFPYEPRE